MTDTLRTFIAIDVKVEKPLNDKWAELKSLLRNDSIKWVDDHLLHLTLFFLGDTSNVIVNVISSKLQVELKKIPAFSLNLQGLGFFGNSKSPRVLWVGISRSEQLMQLHSVVTDCVSVFGFDVVNEKFSPHLTLGRVKHVVSSDKLISFINQSKGLQFQQVVIDKVTFYQSILRPEGPIYKPLSEFKLLSL